MATTSNTIKIGLEINDQGTLQIKAKDAADLRKQLDAGQKAAVLLSKGISDPTRKAALEVEVETAKELTREINRVSSESKAAARAMQTLNTGAAATAGGQRDSGLLRGTAAGNSRGDARDFARQAQGLGGLVHLYATFAANIWAVTAAYQGLSKAFEQSRMEEAASKLSGTLGVSMKNLANDIRATSGYAVDFKDAMSFGALGVQAGLTTNQITELVKAAKGAANVLGRDVNDSINRMIRGTAKMEQEILDELGIFVRANDAYTAYAKKQGYASKEMLSQTERVKAYADAVSKASEKYKKFAEIEDPFSKLSATITNATNSILNFVNKGIAPVISQLAESGKLVEALLVAGGAYLTKLALPAIKNFSQSLFDTTKYQTAALTANKNLIIDLEHQLAASAAKSFNFSPDQISNMSKSFDKLIDPTKLSDRFQKALIGATSSADFQKKIQTSLERSATAKETAASRATSVGNAKRATELSNEARLIREQADALKRNVALNAEIDEILKKRIKTKEDEIRLQKLLNDATQQGAYLNSVEGKRFQKAERTNAASQAIGSAAGSLFSFDAEHIAESWKNVVKTWSGLKGPGEAVSAVFKTLASSVKLLGGALGIVLGIWMAWDLVLEPVARWMGIITDLSGRSGVATDRLGESVKTAQDTWDAYSTTVGNAPEDLALAAKAQDALSNSIKELSSNLTMATNAYSTFLANSTKLDRFIDWSKSFFDADTASRFNAEFQKTIQLMNLQGIDTSALENSVKLQGEIADLERQLKEADASKRSEPSLLAQLNPTTAIISNISILYDRTRYLGRENELITEITRKSQERAKADEKSKKEIEDRVKISEQTSKYLGEFNNLLSAAREIETINASTIKGTYKFSDQVLGNASSSLSTISAITKGIQEARKTGGPIDENILKGSNAALDQILGNLFTFAEIVKDPKLLEAYRTIAVLNRAALSAPLSSEQQKALEGATQQVVDTLIKADKKKKDIAKTEEQQEAARQKAAQALITAKERIDKFDKESLTRKIEATRLEETLQGLQSQGVAYKTAEMLAAENTLRNTKQTAEFDKKRQEAELEFNKIANDLPKTKEGIKLKERILDILSYQKGIINEEQKRQKEINSILDERASKEAEYQKFNIYTTQALEHQYSLESKLLEAKKSLGLISDKEHINQQATIESLKIQAELSDNLKKNESLSPAGKEQQDAIARRTAQYKQEELDFDTKIKLIEQERQHIQAVLNAQLDVSNQKFQYYIDNAYKGVDITELEAEAQKGIALQIDLKAKAIALQTDPMLRQLEIEKASYELATQQYEKEKQIFNARKQQGSTDTATIAKEMAYRLQEIKKQMKNITDTIVDAVFNSIDKGVDKLFNILNSKKKDFRDIFDEIGKTIAEEFQNFQKEQVKTLLKQMVYNLLDQKAPQTVEEIQKDMATNIEKQVSSAQEYYRNQLAYSREIAQNTSKSSSGTSINSSVASTTSTVESIVGKIYPDFNNFSKVIEDTSKKSDDLNIAANAAGAQVTSMGFKTLTEVDAQIGGLTIRAVEDVKNAILSTAVDKNGNPINTSSTSSSSGTSLGSSFSLSGINEWFSNTSDSIYRFFGTQTGAVGSWISKTFASISEGVGKVTGSLQGVLDKFNLGGIASYAGSIISLFKGDIKGAITSAVGTAIGSIIGGPAGGLIGSVASSVLGGLFGGGHVSRPKYYADTEIKDGKATTIKKWGNSDAKNAKTATVASDPGLYISNAIIKLSENLGAKVEKGLILGTRYMSKYDSIGVSVGMPISKTNREFNIQDVSKNKEAVSNLVSMTFLTAVKKGFIKLEPFLSRLIGTIDELTVEKASSALEMVLSVRELYKQLDNMPTAFSAFKKYIAETFDIDNLDSLKIQMEQLSKFYDLFYTDSEKAAVSLNSLNMSITSTFSDINSSFSEEITKVFSSASLEIPKSNKEFRTLVETLLATEGPTSGLYNALIKIAPNFAEFTKIIGEFNRRLKDAKIGLQSLTNWADNIVKGVLSNFSDIDIIDIASPLVELYKRLDPKPITNVNSAFVLLKDTFAAAGIDTIPNTAKEMSSLIEGFDTTKEGAKESLTALISVGNAFVDFSDLLDSSISDALDAISNHIDNLQSQIDAMLNPAINRTDKALHEVTTLADRQISNIDDQITAIERDQSDRDRTAKYQIHDLREQIKPIDSAIKDLTDANTATQKMYDGASKYISISLTTAQKTVDALKGISDSLAAAVSDLRRSVDSVQKSLSTAAFSKIDSMISTGKINVSTEELNQLVSDARSQLKTENYSSSFDLSRDTLTLAGKLEQLKGINDAALTPAENQVKALNLQLEYMASAKEAAQQMFEAQMAKLEDQKKIFEDQITAIEASRENDRYLADKQLDKLQLQKRDLEDIKKSAQDMVDKLREETLTISSIDQGMKVLRDVALIEFAVRQSVLPLQQELEMAKNNFENLRSSAFSLGSIDSRMAALITLTAQANSLPVPAFASGGLHEGGLRLVGENGPELEVTDPSMIYNTKKTQEMLSNSKPNDAETIKLKEEVAALRQDNRAQASAMVSLLVKLNNVFNKWDGAGMPEVRVV